MQTGRIVSHLSFGCAYFLIASATIVATRLDGGVAYVWVASALLVAKLDALKTGQWAGYLVSSAVASILATGIFGLGWAPAPLMALINISEAGIAALILKQRRFDPDDDALAWLRVFLLAVLASTAVSAISATAIAYLNTKARPSDLLFDWLVGHSMGLLIFTPLFVQMFDGTFKSWWRNRAKVSPLGTACLLGIMAVATAGTFFQERLPLLFMPILPLVLLTYHRGRFGAAFGVIILAIVATTATVSGHGPLMMVEFTFGGRLQFLQVYLAGVVLTILPLAAVLSRRDRLFQQLRESEARYRMLADLSADIVVSLDVDGKFLFVAGAMEAVSGHQPHLLIGRSPLEIIDPAFHDAVRSAHHATLAAKGETVRVEYLAKTKPGQLRWFETNGRAILDDTGSPTGVVGWIRDIHDRKSVEVQLAREASTDALTGALNRRAFIARVDGVGVQNTVSTIAIMDLDNFKAINDRFGHAAGDATLQLFVDIASSMIRSEDLIARIGGEEFAFFLPNADPRHARIIIQRVLDAFGEARMNFDGKIISATASAGVCELKSTCADALKSADLALYAAKSGGRAQLSFAA